MRNTKLFTTHDLKVARKKAFDKWVSNTNSAFKAHQESRAQQAKEQALLQELQQLRDENLKLLHENLILRTRGVL